MVAYTQGMPSHVDQTINFLNPRKRETSHFFEWPVWSVILNSRCACEWILFSVGVGSEPFSRTEPLPTVDKLGTPEQGLVSDYVVQPEMV